jgi:hypothetical protein
MADNGAPQNNTTIIIQVVFVVLVCLGVVGVALYFGVFSPKKESHSVTMRIENSAGSFQMTYAVPGDEIKSPLTVGSSWEKTFTVKTGSEVYLAGASMVRSGEIKCTLLVDGKTWKSQSAKYPDDKVACAGIVP